MIKFSRRRKFDRCICQDMARGNYCTKCDRAVCVACVSAHIAGHRAADRQTALTPR
jgi:hypothetical protein